MMRRHSFKTGLCCCILLLLAGVGASWSWAADVKPAPPGAPPSSGARPGTAVVPHVATAPVLPMYVYRPAGRSDPFQPFIETDLALLKRIEMEKRKKAAMKGRPLSPLQQADIAQFHLLGIAGSGRKRAAIVVYAPSNKYYPLFEGTHIGTNEGRVVEIEPDRVIVEERFIDQSRRGKRAKFIRTPMMLHKEEEEGKP